jgi:hypothetical protein
MEGKVVKVGQSERGAYKNLLFGKSKRALM